MFEQVVFAGGGNRCWWQAGFWDVVAPALALKPVRIAGVSAGAATACMLHATDSSEVLAYYRERLATRRRNVDWHHLFIPKRRLFPHAEIYRQALTETFSGDRFERLRSTAPELRIVFSRLPRRLGPRSAVALGLLAYNVEKYARRSLHPVFGQKLGFRAETVRLDECANAEDLVSLLMASSCTPPFTPIEQFGGLPTLDGGLFDNVPVHAVEPGMTTLVLVTRRYPRRTNVFTHAGRLYVQPSVKVPASSWDYTRVHAMEATYQLGRNDGERFVTDWSRHRDWLGAAADALPHGGPVRRAHE